MRRKLNKSSTKMHSFFKIMIGDFDEKLRVPSGFIRHFKGKLPQKSTLKSPTGGSWTIKVKRVGKDLFFSRGWQAFVNDHSLQFGDVLFFKCNVVSKFYVKIYGRTGCEKELHFNHEKPMTKVKKAKHEEQMSSSNKKKEGKYPEQRKPAMEIEVDAGAVCAASITKTKHPHFTAICRQNKYEMTIPRDFVIKHGFEAKKKIVLQDPEGRSWPVIITQRPDSRIRMTKGWLNFFKENKLAVGDTCLFELLDRRGNKMSVCILRKAEMKKPARLMLSKRSTSTATLKSLITEQPKGAHVATRAEVRAIKAASLFESENPFCRIVMRPSFVQERFAMHVPSAFGKAYLLRKTKIVTLRVSDEGTWEVGCSFSGNRTRISTGWKKFVLDNHLKEGDVCVFQLVGRKNFEINVSILRV